MSEQEHLVFNGLNAVTGNYLTETTDEELARIALQQYERDAEAEYLRDLEYRHSRQESAPINVQDNGDLAQTGWGVIFAHDADPCIREALQPLLDLRKAQATRTYEAFYREFSGYDEKTGRGGYLPKEAKTDFLVRHGAGGFDSVDPHAMPYYLLLVGDPKTIPYDFQYQLDVQYAVGRIHFDTLEEYAQYAQSVVEAETKMKPLPRTASFFGVCNDGDLATQTSTEHLIKPLVETLLPGFFDKTIREEQSKAQENRARGQSDIAKFNLARADVCADWQRQISMHVAQQASKNTLGHLLGGDQTPALLFTASHGIGFPNGDERQRDHQGALVCQEWPGPGYSGAIGPDWYFAADDVSEQARLLGLIAIFFACYGAGVPQHDEFAERKGEPASIAPYPFVARLPQRLLSHPKGGALAVVGHVERAWGYSFRWESQNQLRVFQDLLTNLMVDGRPIGAALEWFNLKYAEVATELTKALRPTRFGGKLDTHRVARLWTTNNDARSYIILGDPAVRLPVAGLDKAGPRGTIQSVTLNIASSSPPANGGQPETATPTPPADNPPPVSPLSGTDEALGYGLFGSDSIKEARDGLVQALVAVASQVGHALQAAIDDAVSLEVTTYVSDDMNGVSYDAGTRKLSGSVKLRALTRISIDGDMVICLPEKDGQIDTAVWEMHNQMVERAQANRTALLKTAVSAVTGLLDALK